ncbi:helix-turn-helix domain-containing protein [Streptomyces mirabilis]|uniref:helix-turn-helix domain-containing protein n=1 Tax=Streptomyces mirabilis TaxID=68239 RepID=UPI00332824CA
MVMPISLNTTIVDERDRREFVHEALGTNLVPIELHWPERPQGVEAHGVITGIGDITICSGRTTAWRVDRTTKLARDSLEPSVFINVQHRASSLIVQHGREAVGRPGNLVMYDSASPYTLLNETGVTGDFFRIPHAALALPHKMIRDACAVNLSPGHPVTSLTHDYLRRLAADPALPLAPNVDLISHPSVELIRALIVTHANPGADGVATAPPGTIQLHILEYVNTHLFEPDLSAERIAAANYISVRYLYKALSNSGISLADWIRTRRLEACRRLLAGASHTTKISTVARHCGFSDMSSFSRSFRAAYGMTPREWRDREGASFTEAPDDRPNSAAAGAAESAPSRAGTRVKRSGPAHRE